MSETIIFFGSGPVAAESLRLLSTKFDVEFVITKPQPQHHKHDFPVIKVAEEINVPIITTMNNSQLRDQFKVLDSKSRLGVVIDFGIIIDNDVINKFPLGILNSHFSLLPKLRGADPITFSILEGHAQTGVSLMKIVEALDEGPILDQNVMDMPFDVTTPELTETLIQMSDELLKRDIPKYLNGELKVIQQGPESEASYSRKIKKTDSILDFNLPAVQLERQVRAYIEWPKTKLKIDGISMSINKASVKSGTGTPGSLYFDENKLGVYTIEDIFVCETVVPDGKKEMQISSFLAGRPSINQNSIVTN